MMVTLSFNNDAAAIARSNLPKEHKLNKFSEALSGILETAGYDEMYGVKLVAPEGE